MLDESLASTNQEVLGPTGSKLEVPGQQLLGGPSWAWKLAGGPWPALARRSQGPGMSWRSLASTS